MGNGCCRTGEHCLADLGTAEPERVSCAQVSGENVPANSERKSPTVFACRNKQASVAQRRGSERAGETSCRHTAVGTQPSAVFYVLLVPWGVTRAGFPEK